MSVFLKNWFVHLLGDGFTAPENRVQTLVGEASGHPKPGFPDGSKIQTSEITGYFDGPPLLIRTKDGTIYRPEEMEEGYRQWRLSQGFQSKVDWSKFPKFTPEPNDLAV